MVSKPEIQSMAEKEIEIFEQYSPLNYLLRVHNLIGDFVYRETKKGHFFTKELLVADINNDNSANGAWVDMDDNQHLYVVFDVDYIRAIYSQEMKYKIVLAIWSIDSHEWGHIYSQLDMNEKWSGNNPFNSINDTEAYAEEKMQHIMHEFGFTDDEIKDGYEYRYSILENLRNDDLETGIVSRDGVGTKTDFREVTAALMLYLSQFSFFKCNVFNGFE